MAGGGEKDVPRTPKRVEVVKFYNRDEKRKRDHQGYGTKTIVNMGAEPMSREQAISISLHTLHSMLLCCCWPVHKCVTYFFEKIDDHERAELKSELKLYAEWLLNILGRSFFIFKQIKEKKFIFKQIKEKIHYKNGP
ncbi:hypothetical protein TELCIR_12832 [Teladorsagia circumcincta]|uniref:Uncharacterized protein n=1 Tax=Teladorsagia circumcincta TaxID=45464 RepID=A0A2G9U5G3_TELCI|nr:hypothetical protein TELCIR_12832 [Teladorsagia circumcincta]